MKFLIGFATVLLTALFGVVLWAIFSMNGKVQALRADTPSPVATGPSTVKEFTQPLNDGRTVTCLWAYTYDSRLGSVSCDWGNAR